MLLTAGKEDTLSGRSLVCFEVQWIPPFPLLVWWVPRMLNPKNDMIATLFLPYLFYNPQKEMVPVGYQGIWATLTFPKRTSAKKAPRRLRASAEICRWRMWHRPAETQPWARRRSRRWQTQLIGVQAKRPSTLLSAWRTGHTHRCPFRVRLVGIDGIISSTCETHPLNGRLWGCSQTFGFLDFWRCVMVMTSRSESAFVAGEQQITKTCNTRI